MLKTLYIKNVALIEDAEINFKEGLNVLSGETGSGKSVILEALNFVLGAKADKAIIKSGENECFVKASFDVLNFKEIVSVFNDLDIEYEDTLIISRKLSIDGKNVVKINGITSTISMIKQFTSKLVDVHGQSEHFYLLDNNNQLKLIDKMCVDNVSDIKNNILSEYSNYKNIVNSIELLGGDATKRQNRIDLLKYQINEIENADIKENEEEELKEIKNKLISKEKILNALSLLKQSIDFDGGASDILSNSRKEMSHISVLGQEFNDLYEKLSAVTDNLSEISTDCSNLISENENFDYDPNEIEERLDLIKKIKNKYGDSLSEINLFLDNSKTELDKLLNFEKEASDLIIKKEKSQNVLYDLYKSLSLERKKCSKVFVERTLKEIRELGMKNAEFDVKFSDFPSINECLFNQDGQDKVEFVFSANLGEPLKNLSFIISGGECSRFMLAIKSVTSKYNNISTFIFDEIDSGIGGETAKIVAKKFYDISKNTQIIAVSHLSQITAMADENILIEKVENNGKTYTTFNNLDYDGKVKEIVRLIGGNINNDSANKLAKDIINEANLYKN